MRPDPVTVSTIAGQIRHIVRTNLQAPKTYLCVGDIDVLQATMQALRRELGWSLQTETDLFAVPTFLCIGITEDAQLDVDAAVRTAGWPPFVSLAFGKGIKRTSVIMQLEQLGYRAVMEREQTAHFAVDALPVPFDKAERLQLGDPRAQLLLAKSLRRIRHLPLASEVSLLTCDGVTLLRPERFDIAIKASYARLWIKGRAEDWRTRSYYEHALRITGPGQSLEEHDGTGKAGIEQFLSEFHSLLHTTPPEAVPPFRSIETS